MTIIFFHFAFGLNLLANDNDNDELANNIDTRLQSSHQQPIQLNEIFRDELSANYFNGSWISNNEIAFYDVEYNLCLYNVEQQITKQFIHFIQVVSNSNAFDFIFNSFILHNHV